MEILYGAKLSYDVRRDFEIESSLAVVRDTAVVLRKKHAVVYTSNRDESFNAQANTKRQSSNNMAKGLVSRIAIVLVKARFSAAKRIPGICGE